MMTWNNLGLQESASPNMWMMLFFHDHLLLILTLITSLVLYMIFFLMMNKFYFSKMSEFQLIEIMWTITPAIILLMIAFPSLKILYLMEEGLKPSLTIKSIGNQWYWNYEYSDFEGVELEAYMSPLTNLTSFRLLETDNSLILPYATYIRNLVSSNDVIHAWSVPSMSLKIDAVPGRLNQTSFMINRPGMYFGQCSEICGANHSFMPILINSTSMDNFFSWMKQIYTN